MIKLSEKHGVNPTIPVCFYCGKDKNEVILAGKMKDDVEAPKKAVWDRVPCDECKKWMEQGIIIIIIDEDKTEDMDNPFRTGQFAVVSDEAFTKSFSGEAAELAAKTRYCFIVIEAAEKAGLFKLMDKYIEKDVT